MSARAQRGSTSSGALLLLACSLPPSFAASALACTGRIEPIASFVFVTESVPAISLREMVGDLRDAGLPVAAIAEMARVERKTVYAWLDGGEARPERESRLAEIHYLLTSSGLDLRALWRFAGRPLSSGTTLREYLSAEVLDAADINDALYALKPTVERQARREAARLATQTNSRHSVLDDVPTADLG